MKMKLEYIPYVGVGLGFILLGLTCLPDPPTWVLWIAGFIGILIAVCIVPLMIILDRRERAKNNWG